MCVHPFWLTLTFTTVSEAQSLSNSSWNTLHWKIRYAWSRKSSQKSAKNSAFAISPSSESSLKPDYMRVWYQSRSFLLGLHDSRTSNYCSPRGVARKISCERAKLDENSLWRFVGGYSSSRFTLLILCYPDFRQIIDEFGATVWSSLISALWMTLRLESALYIVAGFSIEDNDCSVSCVSIIL